MKYDPIPGSHPLTAAGLPYIPPHEYFPSTVSPSAIEPSKPRSDPNADQKLIEVGMLVLLVLV